MHSFGAKEWADKCEQLEATIADLQGQVTELEGKNGFTQGTFSELYALRQRVAQLEKEKASTVAAAIELVDSKSCDTHKQEIKAEGFDVFYDKEKKAGCQRCLQADHARVLGLVQEREYEIKRRIWAMHGSRMGHQLYGDDGRLDCNTCFRKYSDESLETVYGFELYDANVLCAKAASLPAQPAQGGASNEVG